MKYRIVQPAAVSGCGIAENADRWLRILAAALRGKQIIGCRNRLLCERKEMRTMRIKEGFVIKKLGSGFVVVTVGRAAEEFNGMIRLNATGAFLWQSIQGGADSKEKLVRLMTDRYEGLEEAEAARDLEEFLGSIGFALAD